MLLSMGSLLPAHGTLIQQNHRPSARLQTGQYGKDPEADFLVDAASDAYNDWMNAWTSLIGKADTDDAVKDYRSTSDKFYAILEWYYAKKSSPSSAFLSGGALQCPVSAHTCLCLEGPRVLQLQPVRRSLVELKF